MRNVVSEGESIKLVLCIPEWGRNGMPWAKHFFNQSQPSEPRWKHLMKNFAP